MRAFGALLEGAHSCKCDEEMVAPLVAGVEPLSLTSMKEHGYLPCVMPLPLLCLLRWDLSSAIHRSWGTVLVAEA